MVRKYDEDKFDRVRIQIRSLYNEIGFLSKKSPDNPLNKFKIKYINAILVDANKLLVGKNRPFPDFESFEEDNLPTNSDVAMILGQYLRIMDELHSSSY